MRFSFLTLNVLAWLCVAQAITSPEEREKHTNEKLQEIQDSMAQLRGSLMSSHMQAKVGYRDMQLSKWRKLRVKADRLLRERDAAREKAAAFAHHKNARVHLPRLKHGLGKQMTVRQTIEQPLDHFFNETSITFKQSYYYSTAFYKSTSERKHDGDKNHHVPVFFYDPGEQSVVAEENWTYDYTMLHNLAREFGGIALVAEHRYYGLSQPNRSELGPGKTWGMDQMRWLDTKQSLEDSAELIRHVRFNDTHADDEYRFIYYGGSYAGARSVFMRTSYPELVFGAISSSGVVSAVEHFPEYFYPIARGAEVACTQALQSAVHAIDTIIAPTYTRGSHQEHIDESAWLELLQLFGLEGLKRPSDFGQTLTTYIGDWQSNSWRKRTGPFYDFCAALRDYDRGAALKKERAQHFPSLAHMPWTVFNYADYLNRTLVQPCLKRARRHSSNPAEHCFGSDMRTFREDKGLLSDDKAWTWQTCKEYGFFQTAPTHQSVDGRVRYSGPKLVSDTVDLHAMTIWCRDGYTPGNEYQLPSKPDTTTINERGNVDIDVDRLAIVNSQFDPWRPASQHSEEFAYGGVRTSTYDRPFHLVPGAILAVSPLTSRLLALLRHQLAAGYLPGAAAYPRCPPKLLQLGPLLAHRRGHSIICLRKRATRRVSKWS